MINAATDQHVPIQITDYSNQTDKDSWENQKHFLKNRVHTNADIKSDVSFERTGWPALKFCREDFAKPRIVEVKNQWIKSLESYINNTSNKRITFLEGELFSGSEAEPIFSIYSKHYSNVNSTTQTEKSAASNLSPIIMRIFSNGKDEIFEDGMESNFSRELCKLIYFWGNDVIKFLIDVIPSGIVNVEVGAEALRWVGRIKDPRTYEIRRWLLENSLFSKLPRIRDGACLGLESMNDYRSKVYLQMAIEKEPIATLREDLELVLKDLETNYAISTKNTKSQMV